MDERAERGVVQGLRRRRACHARGRPRIRPQHWRRELRPVGRKIRSSQRGGLKPVSTITGKCFCGAVEVEVEGAPEAMGYCHCSSCRSWSAAPVNAFTLWKQENVRITKGADQVGSF